MDKGKGKQVVLDGFLREDGSKPWLANLNDAQKEGVTWQSTGGLQILAGPGSGKDISRSRALSSLELMPRCRGRVNRQDARPDMQGRVSRQRVRAQARGAHRRHIHQQGRSVPGAHVRFRGVLHRTEAIDCIRPPLTPPSDHLRRDHLTGGQRDEAPSEDFVGRADRQPHPHGNLPLRRGSMCVTGRPGALSRVRRLYQSTSPLQSCEGMGSTSICPTTFSSQIRATRKLAQIPVLFRTSMAETRMFSTSHAGNPS